MLCLTSGDCEAGRRSLQLCGSAGPDMLDQAVESVRLELWRSSPPLYRFGLAQETECQCFRQPTPVPVQAGGRRGE